MIVNFFNIFFKQEYFFNINFVYIKSAVHNFKSLHRHHACSCRLTNSISYGFYRAVVVYPRILYELSLPILECKCVSYANASHSKLRAQNVMLFEVKARGK